MRKTNFTFLSLVLAFMSFVGVRANAQECLLSANDNVTISMNAACLRTITPADVLNNIDPQTCTSLGLVLEYPYPSHYGYLAPDKVDASLIGYTLLWRVIDSTTGNYAWGYVRIEDKFPPQIVCMNDTVSCLRADAVTLMAEAQDSCGLFYVPEPKIEFLERKWVSYDCDQDTALIGYMTRRVRAIDLWGNSMECRDTLWIAKETLDSLVCGPDTALACNHQMIVGSAYKDILWQTGVNGYTYLDADGYAHPWPTDGDGIWPAPYLKSVDPGQDDAYMIPGRSATGPVFNNNGKCHIVYDYKDHVIPTCGKSYKIRRVWTIYDWCARRDTECIQWFKVVDTTPPYIMEEMRDAIGDRDRALVAPEYLYGKDITVYAGPHDCKAGIALADIRPYVERRAGKFYDGAYAKECDDQLQLLYEVVYTDPNHAGKDIIISGDYDVDGGHLYLPAGWHYVLWTIRDRCWNEYKIWQRVGVIDDTPPTPVCDEITQTTLDPKECWSRIYAKDLDDGSHDNCCQYLHFAVANMDTITYWRSYWEDYFAGCLDPYDYHHYEDYINAFIEEWINVFVFDDYIDVTECGEEQLVVRVYEACDLPLYDDHLFYGGEHEWFWFNNSAWFASWYMWKLDEYKHYGDPRAALTCYSSTELFNTYAPIGWDFPVNWYFNTSWVPSGGLSGSGYHNCDVDANVAANSAGGQSVFEHFYGQKYGAHQETSWSLCAWYPNTTAAVSDWTSRVYNPYKTDAQITQVLLTNRQYYIQPRYNDCMIQLLKDDKVPPVVVAPDDITVYCDGVPYWGTITYGPDKYNFHGAMFAHDVCYGNDDLVTSGCFMDDTKADVIELGHTHLCTKIPWDGGDYGYYGGYACGDGGYSYSHCQELYEWYDHDWSPIYCRVWLWLDVYDNPDGGHPDPQRYFDETTDDWEISDNCWYPDVDDKIEGSLNECGVGTYTRTMTATDKCGNTSYDHQTLYVKPRSDFEVIFPADVLAECTDASNLDATAEGAGYPIISDDDCELIGVTYKDERFDIVDEACYKILRTWKIIDWCVYSPDIHSRYPDVIVDDRLVAGDNRCCIHRNLKDDGDGYMEYLQVIKVIDLNAPVVACNDLDETCIYDSNCTAAEVTYDLGSATDECTPADQIEYRWIVSKGGVAEDYGTGTILEGSYSVGTHDVLFIAKDNCGNEDTCETYFTIRDCKKPTPYCYNGIATVIMPSSGSVDVWAIDLDAGSYDNCTASDKLLFTFSEVAPADDPDFSASARSSKMTFTCDDLGNQPVTIYVWDEEGNYDFCETYLLIQPGTDACPGASTASINGQITTEASTTVEYVNVDLSSANGNLPAFKTGVDGKYAFGNVLMSQNYVVKPERNDDYTNGVSTLDILAIQKHILGIEQMDSPYKVIAADVNADDKITAVDLVELRKLVLGIYDELPNNTSWRFVPKTYAFADAMKPWGFPEEVSVANMSANEVTANFVGVKVGDVNGSSKANSQQLQGAEIRTNTELVFQIEDANVVAGQEVTVAFNAKNFTNVAGYQFTLNVEGLEVTGVAGAKLNVDANNFGLNRKGVVTTSWNDTKGLSILDGESLFTITAVAKESGRLSKMMQVTSAVTHAEAYVNGESANVGLEFVNNGQVVSTGDYALYQNNPNPFTTETLIGFVLPSKGNATLKVMDVTGKVLKVVRGEYAKGYNEIKLAKKDLNATGVLYYQIESGDYVATKKMVLID
ncbi:MAG: T9SS type A sorting domain-containing protein [Lewinellaceae bacterium]|nr:T9SS type A sorting domain-containing protein [Lewinellaceae bacterium]